MGLYKTSSSDQGKISNGRRLDFSRHWAIV
jgi:hypothetical protein